jgi:hypothetical protein
MTELRPVQHPLGFCSVHGVFSAPALALGAGSGATFINCGTTCPICRRPSEIIPGHYEAHADRLNLLVDPRISPEALAALQRLAKAASTGQISVEKAREEAEKIQPGAGRLFDIADWPAQAKATLYAAIVGATGVVMAASIASTRSSGPAARAPSVIEEVYERRNKDDLLSTSALKPVERIPIPRPRPKAVDRK